MNIKRYILFPFIVSMFIIILSITAFAGSFQPTIIRFGGNDRYDVAANVSMTSYPDGTSNVILVNGSNIKLSDALTATPLAAALKAPILLVSLDTIPDATSKEITRLKPKNIYIIGGTGSVSQGIEYNLIKNYNIKNYNITRITGANRYEVAKNVANKLKELLGKTSFDKAYVCNGYKYADALAVAPVAAKEGNPILFVSAGLDSDTKNTAAYINSLGIKNVDAIGGWGSISNDVVNTLKARRIDGLNRAALSTTIASTYYKNPDGVFIVNGYCPADALALGPYAVNYNFPILFIDNDGRSIDTKVKGYIDTNSVNIESMLVSGGPASVTLDALSSIANGYTGLSFLDTNTKLDRNTCNLIKAQGFTGVIRYVGLTKADSSDLTKDEMNDILQSGLGLMVVQHPRVGQTVNAQLGTQDGNTAVTLMNQLEPADRNFILWLNLEGIKEGTPIKDIIDYCNKWFDAVKAGGYIPGIYVGYDTYMSSSDLYSLSFEHYWKSMSVVPDVAVRGYEMIQGGLQGSLKLPMYINGVEVDVNTVYRDHKGDSIVYLTNNGVIKP